MAPLLLQFGGCATITRGTTEAFIVNSKPVGADVRLSSGEICKTPCVLKKKRKGSFVVFITKEGYEPVEVQVTNQVAGAGAVGIAGNVVLGGLIGAVVDASSGAMLKLVPNPMEVELEPLFMREEAPKQSTLEQSTSLQSEQPLRGDGVEEMFGFREGIVHEK